MATIPRASNVSRPVASGYGAKLTWGSGATENMYLPLSVSPQNPIQRVTAPDDSQVGRGLETNPLELRPESGFIFARSELTGGEGLAFAHVPDPTPLDPSRYWDSEGVDIDYPEAGDPAVTKLATVVEAVPSTSSANTNLFMLRGPNVRIYWADGASVKYTGSIHAATPAIGTENPDAGEGGSPSIVGLAIRRAILYVALGSQGIHKRAAAGTYSHWSDLQATGLWSSKNRIFAAVDNVFYEAAAGVVGNSTIIFTAESGAAITSVADGGAMLLVGADDGLIYSIAPNNNLILEEKFQNRLFSEGEYPTAIEQVQGLILVGTAEVTSGGGYIGRLYVGQTQGYRIVNMVLVRQWGEESETVDRSIKQFATTRDSVYFGVVEDSGETHIWKYLLATAGVTRNMVASASGVAKGLVTLDEKPAWSISGSGLYRGDDAGTFVTTGYIIYPAIDFMTPAKKSWVGIRVDNKALSDAGGTPSIQVYYSTNTDAIENPTHASWTLAGTINESSGSGAGVDSSEIALSGVVSRYLCLKVVLNRGAATYTPELLYVAVRGIPNHDEVMFEVPVNVSDRWERPGRQPIDIRGRGEAIYAELKSREGSAGQLEILSTGETVRGFVQQVLAPMPYVPPRGSATLVAKLRVRGTKV